jgi:hypothetical protein
VGPRAVVVREVPGQDVAQVALAQDEDVIETLSPYRADEPFRERILPRAMISALTDRSGISTQKILSLR